MDNDTSSETHPLLDHQRDSGHERNYKGNRFVPIEIAACLYFISTWVALPVANFYILGKIQDRYNYNGSSSHVCGANQSDVEIHVEKEKAQYLMYAGFLSCFPAFIPVLFLGTCMDKYGRKKPMLVTMTGSIIKQVIYLIVIVTDVRIEYLFIGNVVEGLTGYFGGTLMGLFSILSDITDKGQSRAMRMVLAEFLFTACGSVSELLCGYLIKDGTHYEYGMLISIVFMSSSWLFLAIVIPETHGGTRLSGNVFSLSTIKRTASFYIHDTRDHRRARMLMSIAVVFLVVPVHLSFPGLVVLTLQSSPLCWPEVRITTFKSLSYETQFLCAILSTKFLQKVFKCEELSIATFGCLSTICYVVLFGAADVDHTWLIYLGAVGGLCYLSTISLMRAYMSRQCPSTEQGSLFAGIACVEMFVTSLAGIAFTQIYKSTFTLYHGFVYMMMAGTMLVSVLILLSLYRKDRVRKRTYGDLTVAD